MPVRLSACLLLAAAMWPVASRGAQTTVDQLQGFVNDNTYQVFEKFITSHLDKIIGLKIGLMVNSDGPLTASASDGQFVIYRTQNPPDEIVASSGYTYERGAFGFNGFFIVKSGGIHQGTASYGLEPVSEATVRRNPTVRIRPVSLGR